MGAAVLILSWHTIPDTPPGSVEVEKSRLAIAAVIQGVLPRCHVDSQLLTFVPLEDGRTQVNVHGFGPFGVLSQIPELGPANCPPS